MKLLRTTLQEQVALGFSLSYAAPGMIERVGKEWDWIWIDGQHGQFDYRTTLECVRACDLVGTPAIVRVPDHSYGNIGRALDMGAAGVMVPMVNTPEEAAQIVRAAKFAPLGQRSYGGRRAADRYGGAYPKTANEDTLLIVQIESGEAVENSERIAAVPGVDVLFFGPGDRAVELGLPMDKPTPPGTFGVEYDRVVAAAEKLGKYAGALGYSAESFEEVVGRGFRLVASCGDVLLLSSGSTATRDSMGKILCRLGREGEGSPSA